MFFLDIEYLKRLKQAKNLTVKDLAKLTDIPEGTITNVLSGKTENPSFDVIAKLATTLGASAEEIIYGVGISAEKEDEVVSAINAIREIYENQIRYLNKDKFALALLSAVLLAFILTVLIIDLLNGGIGYIRY